MLKSLSSSDCVVAEFLRFYEAEVTTPDVGGGAVTCIGCAHVPSARQHLSVDYNLC